MRRQIGTTEPIVMLTTSAIRVEYNGLVTMMPPVLVVKPIAERRRMLHQKNLSGALRTGQGDQSCETTRMRIAVHGMRFLCLQMLPQKYPPQMMVAPNHIAIASHNLLLRPFCQPGRNRWKTNTTGWRATKMIEVIANARLLRRAK